MNIKMMISNTIANEDYLKSRSCFPTNYNAGICNEWH